MWFFPSLWFVCTMDYVKVYEMQILIFTFAFAFAFANNKSQIIPHFTGLAFYKNIHTHTHNATIATHLPSHRRTNILLLIFVLIRYHFWCWNQLLQSESVRSCLSMLCPNFAHDYDSTRVIRSENLCSNFISSHAANRNQSATCDERIHSNRLFTLWINITRRSYVFNVMHACSWITSIMYILYMFGETDVVRLCKCSGKQICDATSIPDCFHGETFFSLSL